MFPLLAFFLSSPTSHAPFLPPPPSLLANYVNYFASAPWRSDTAPWSPTRTESALISPRLSHVCKVIRIESHIRQQLSVVYLVFFCLVVCLILVWVVFLSVVWMCFIIFGWSCLLWIQIRKIAKNVLIKNRLEIRLKFYKKLVTFMKNCADR